MTHFYAKMRALGVEMTGKGATEEVCRRFWDAGEDFGRSGRVLGMVFAQEIEPRIPMYIGNEVHEERGRRRRRRRKSTGFTGFTRWDVPLNIKNQKVKLPIKMQNIFDTD